MSREEKKGKTRRYLWIKRGVAVVAIGIWFLLMFNIFTSGETMADQAPKCIFTTMIVFGILTAVYKGLELLERKEEEPK
jgi:hypothetical protein